MDCGCHVSASLQEAPVPEGRNVSHLLQVPECKNYTRGRSKAIKQSHSNTPQTSQNHWQADIKAGNT
ncbi:hypothetical protein UPYG_G00193650 [Umbra pygmaea]|uniref:Uncharacterized protein n=1 Tax=Umbra pygmaea TaxID=75934 RepID=A0ABD0WGM4_UMBPY